MFDVEPEYQGPTPGPAPGYETINGYAYDRDNYSGFSVAEGRSIRWQVARGDTYDRVLPGTVNRAPLPDRTSLANVKPVASESWHTYVKSENGRDFWSGRFGAGVYSWQTPVGMTSGSILQETYSYVPDPVSVPPLTTSSGSSAASNLVTGGTVTKSPPATGGAGTGGGGPNGAASGVQTVGAVVPADAGARSYTNHVYVGRDARGDVWQIFDGNRVLEWAVKIGDQSAAVIDSSLRDLGPPSNMTVAKGTTTTGTTPTAGTTPTTTGTTTGTGAVTPAPLTGGQTVAIGALAVFAKAFLFS